MSVAELAYVTGAAPRVSAVIRRSPQDFIVNELLELEFSGAGEHLWIEVQKTGHTTPQIASHLCRHFNIPVRDVGYSGLKDRRAVTRQWFSVPTPENGEELPDLAGIEWLQSIRHSRKLRRGTHNGNAFTLQLHDIAGDTAQLESALQRIREQGFPNYFGEQRFSDGRNLENARRLFAGRRLKRPARSMALSATRSLLFNAVLDQRVREATWNCLMPGEAVMLNGSQSVFPYPQEDAERKAVDERSQRFDVHPSGPLPGTGVSVCQGEAGALEANICGQHADLVEGLHAFGVKQARRVLRVVPGELRWSWQGSNSLVINFSLPTGVFATALLRECVKATESRE